MGQSAKEITEAAGQSVLLDAVHYHRPDLSGKALSIGIAMSRFNQPVCRGLREACLAELQALGVDLDRVELATVPGALEIPLALQAMADSGRFDALIALGAVIRGETYHFELVSNESSAGVSRVGLDYGIPIANAILTVENDAQAQVRMQEKGTDAARVAVEMANLQRALRR